jgi:lipoprotein NlpI
VGPGRSGYRRHGKLIARGAFAGFCLIAGTALAEWTPDAQRCAGNEGSPDERIAACSRAIASGKLSAEDLATTHYNRALEWRAKREDDKALADYGEAIRINPRYAVAYNNRGNIYRANGEYDRAIADFDAALRINPKYAFAHNNLGMALFFKGELDRALASFDRAIRLDPKYAYAYNNRGNAWGGKGEYDRGIADFSEAIRLDPKYGNAYSNRGIAWRKKHQYERAVADFTEAIRTIGRNEIPHRHRGYANFFLGRFEAAAGDFAESAGLEPTNLHTTIWRQLARARAAQDAAAAQRELSALRRSWPMTLFDYFTGRIGTDALLRELVEHAMTLSQEWPVPAMDFLAGRIDAAALLKAAEHADSTIQSERLCDANYYIGQRHLAAKHLAEARTYLQQAEKSCPKDLIAYEGAVAELKRAPR